MRQKNTNSPKFKNDLQNSVSNNCLIKYKKIIGFIIDHKY